MLTWVNPCSVAEVRASKSVSPDLPAPLLNLSATPHHLLSTASQFSTHRNEMREVQAPPLSMISSQSYHGERQSKDADSLFSAGHTPREEAASHGIARRGGLKVRSDAIPCRYGLRQRSHAPLAFGTFLYWVWAFVPLLGNPEATCLHQVVGRYFFASHRAVLRSERALVDLMTLIGPTYSSTCCTCCHQ